MRLVPSTCILSLTLALSVGGCKPERVDVRAQQHAAATIKAQQARQAIKATQGAGRATTNAPKEASGPVLATVGDQAITLGTLDAHIATMPRHMQGRYSTPEAKLRLLQEMVNFEVLAREAQQQGLDQSTEVQQAVKIALVEQLLRAHTSEGMRATDISPEAIEAYYQEHTSAFVTREYRRAAVIVSGNQEDIEGWLAAIKQAFSDSPTLARQIFGDFATENSSDPNTVARRGDLGQFDANGASEDGRQVCSRLYAEKAFSLATVGDITNAFETEDHHWVVLQLTGKSSPITRSLEEARLDIQRALLASNRAQKVNDYIESLRAQAEISIDTEALQALDDGTTPSPDAPEAPPTQNADGEVSSPPRPTLNPRAIRENMMPSGPRGPQLAPIRKSTGLKLSDQEVQEKMRKRKREEQQRRDADQGNTP